MLCPELDMIVMNLYRDLLQKICIQTFSSRGEMLCICNKFDVLFCLCIILSVILNTQTNKYLNKQTNKHKSYMQYIPHLSRGLSKITFYHKYRVIFPNTR